MIDTFTSHITVLPEEKPVQKTFIVNQRAFRKEVETIPGVIATTRHYFLSSTIAFDKHKNGNFKFMAVPVIGFNQEEEKKVLTIRDHMVSGTFPDVLRDDEIVLGSYVAGGYDSVQSTDLGGVVAGDKVRVVYANGVDKLYTVVGVFHVTIGFVGGDAFISEKEAERVLSTYDQASEVLVKVDLARHPLSYYTGAIHAIDPSFTIKTYRERFSSIGVLMDAFDLIAFIIVCISILVAGATIFIIVYINALSKKKQIGIIKAIGITSLDIELSYVFQALFLSVVSILSGTIIFYGGAAPYLKVHPIELPFGDAILVITSWQVLESMVALVIAACVAGYISSRIISKKPIIETVWG